MIAVFRRGGGRLRSRLGCHSCRSAAVRYQIDHQTPDGPSNLRGDVQSAGGGGHASQSIQEEGALELLSLE